MLEAGVIIQKNDNPSSPSYGSQSKFKNLNNAIIAVNNGTLHRITIKNSAFFDNQFGIVLNGANFPYIVNNEFEINPFYQNQVGIALQSTKQYTVMENTIKYTGTDANNQVFGININNGGEIAEDVYKNTLDGCNYGLKADGKNRHNSYQIGLRYICNNLDNYDANAYDIMIDGGFADPEMRIAIFQGVIGTSSLIEAANNFSGTLTTGHSIVNNSNHITYMGPYNNGNGNTGLISQYNTNVDPTLAYLKYVNSLVLVMMMTYQVFLHYLLV